MTIFIDLIITTVKVVFLALLFCMPVAVLLTWADIILASASIGKTVTKRSASRPISTESLILYSSMLNLSK